MNAMRSVRFLVLPLLSIFLFVGACDDSQPSQADSEVEANAESLEQACYHFEVTGDLEYSVTCRDYNISESSLDDGTKSTRITLMQPPVALILEIPEDIEVGQYPLVAVGDPAEPEAVHPSLLYNPLDGQEAHYDSYIDGTITIMRLDDEAISALFNFTARAKSDASDRGIALRGHLRDLQLRR